MTLRNVIYELTPSRETIFIILSIALFKLMVYTHNMVPTGSMIPLLIPGDVVSVNKLAYHTKIPFTDIVIATWGEPEVGDVITFCQRIFIWVQKSILYLV